MSLALITGAAGFLGRHIVREMRSAGWEILAVDSAAEENAALPHGVVYRRMSLPDANFPGLVAEFRPAACVHCAGRASVAASVSDPRADFAAGVVVTEAVLDALRREAKGCRTIFLSSAAVYGQPETLPVSESAKLAPLSPYGYHKRICEILMEQAARLGGVPAASARIFSAYGPGLRRQVLWETAMQYAGKGKAVLRGTGRETRDFIHAVDAARAIRLIVEKGACEGEVYNVATGQETTIRDAAEMLAGFFPSAKPAVFEGGKMTGDPERWVADCSRIRSLGFGTSLPLMEGLRSLADWVKAENSVGIPNV
ncbi:MAG: NAD-dependent epimerase/dehydratase family protein [Terrimicrobiaceae bacterium]